MSEHGESQELFPQLQQLAHGKKRGRIPFVQQLQWTDCGPACLAMAVRYFGHDVTLDEVRGVVGVGRDGSTAAQLVAAAETYKLRARGISLDVEHLKFLPRGSILHWEFNHFVVFERATAKGVHVVDPAMGARFVDEKRFREAFTGVAIVFEPSDAFEPKRAGSGRFAWYWRQLRTQRHLLSRILVTSLMLRLFALAVPLLTALVVDRVVPRADLHLLVVVGAGVAGILVFQLLSSLIRAHLILQLRTNLDTRLTLGFVDYLSRLPFDFFQRRSAGDLMMRVNNNATIRELLTTNALSAILDGALVVVYLVLIAWLSTMMALIVVGLGLLQVALFLLTRRRYRELQARTLETQARSQSYLVEMMAGMSTLKASAAEARAVERWSNLYIDELNVSLDRGRLAALVDGTMSMLTSMSPIVVLVVGAVSVLDGRLTLGQMLAINAVALNVIAPLATMIAGALQLQLLGSYMDRLDDVFHQAPEQSAREVARAPKLSGRITVQELAFRYSDNGPFVLRDVSVDIRAGMRVAIVGTSGSGKSTLAALVAGMYKPTEGRILFDGHDLARLDLKSVRRQLGVVFQQPYLFAGSVRSNIALSDPTLPLDRVIAAAKVACIHDDIERMPMSYETPLIDGGLSLSGGQRQRLALARALVQQPSILVLDEATSALDAETERSVVANLAALACTQIVLAHRLSTIVGADLIVVLEAGEIVETGTHHELVARGRTYARLVAAQLAAAPGQGAV